jgi:hypothetical protein
MRILATQGEWQRNTGLVGLPIGHVQQTDARQVIAQMRQ